MTNKLRVGDPSRDSAVDARPSKAGRMPSEISSAWLLSGWFRVRNGDSWAALENREAQLSRIEAATATLDPAHQALLAQLVGGSDHVLDASDGALASALTALAQRIREEDEE